jgi:hypothetical protein
MTSTVLLNEVENITPKERYIYRKLNTVDDFRLLILSPGTLSDRVKCTLKEVSFASKPTYETISYTWGDPLSTYTVECEGKEIQVTENLYSALQYLRHDNDERILWADAICIDQLNLDERSQQVQLMGDIYFQGKQLLIWLGAEIEEGIKSIECLEKLNKYFLEHEAGYPNDQPDRYHTLPSGESPNYTHLLSMEDEWLIPIANLAKRPWFLRRYVSHF